jgi:hypothetical protein
VKRLAGKAAPSRIECAVDLRDLFPPNRTSDQLRAHLIQPHDTVCFLSAKQFETTPGTLAGSIDLLHTQAPINTTGPNVRSHHGAISLVTCFEVVSKRLAVPVLVLLVLPASSIVDTPAVAAFVTVTVTCHS